MENKRLERNDVEEAVSVSTRSTRITRAATALSEKKRKEKERTKRHHTHAACVQGVDGAQKATQAISHADMRRTTIARLATACRRGAGRAATGVASAVQSTTAYGSRARPSDGQTTWSGRRQ